MSDERYSQVYLSAIQHDAAAALRKAEGVRRMIRLLRSVPAWPTEAHFTLEMARVQLKTALEHVEGALSEFEDKPVESVTTAPEASEEYTLSMAAE